MNYFHSRLLIAAVAAMGMAVAPQSPAATLTFEFNISFGAVPSDGDSPWLRAVFQDVSTDEVQLTLTTPGIVSPEYADEWWFNLNPNLNLADLDIAFQSGPTGTSCLNTVQSCQTKADGDGIFDFRIDFDAEHLTVGDTSVILLSGISGLDATDFNFLSAPSGGAGPFLAAAHIQSTGVANAGSDFVAPTIIPEPFSMFLLGVGLLGIGALTKQTRSRNQGTS